MAVKERSFNIRTDEDTLVKLRELAGGVPVSRYIRELVAGTRPMPESRIERLEREVQELRSTVSVLMAVVAGSLPPDKVDKAILVALRGKAGIQHRSLEDVLADAVPDAEIRAKVMQSIGKVGLEETEQ